MQYERYRNLLIDLYIIDKKTSFHDYIYHKQTNKKYKIGDLELDARIGRLQREIDKGEKILSKDR